VRHHPQNNQRRRRRGGEGKGRGRRRDRRRTRGGGEEALPLEPHLQSILLWLFWGWDLTNHLLRLALNCDLSISVSQIVRIIDMSHHTWQFLTF
jgi:hypothetical protein